MNHIKMLIKSLFCNMIDRRGIKMRRKIEYNKVNDPRRIKILETVTLTQQQKKNIDGLYGLNYGEKIPYRWHRLYTAFTGKYDDGYFPELLFIPEFEKFENPYKEYAVVFEDKNVISLLGKAIGVKTPEVYCSRQAGLYRDGNYNACSFSDIVRIIKSKAEVFAKPGIESGSGKGCQLIKTGGGGGVDDSKIINILENLGSDFVVQEIIRCHHSIKNIYSGSVNTFRIITYRWYSNGKYIIKHMPVILRIGKGGNYLDNAHAGGMFIAVDDDGTLHDKAFTEFRDIYYSHPDTGVVFGGYRIELVPEVIKCAEKCAAALSSVGCINFDFTIDEEGNPVLIEANCTAGSIWLPQIAHGKGGFADDIAEVLEWLGMIKSLNVEERQPYYYGRRK